MEREYQVTGPVPGRFDYRTFCCDLQPVAKAGAVGVLLSLRTVCTMWLCMTWILGPYCVHDAQGPGLEERLAALPRDNSQTSPLAVRGLEEDEMQAVCCMSGASTCVGHFAQKCCPSRERLVARAYWHGSACVEPASFFLECISVVEACMPIHVLVSMCR